MFNKYEIFFQVLQTYLAILPQILCPQYIWQSIWNEEDYAVDLKVIIEGWVIITERKRREKKICQ